MNSIWVVQRNDACAHCIGKAYFSTKENALKCFNETKELVRKVYADARTAEDEYNFDVFSDNGYIVSSLIVDTMEIDTGKWNYTWKD